MRGRPSTVAQRAILQIERRQQADRQVGPLALEVDGVEIGVVQRLGRTLELVDALLPCLERIGLVEAADVPDLLPQPLERRIVVQVGEESRAQAGVG